MIAFGVAAAATAARYLIRTRGGGEEVPLREGG
jgi:hypothetical protein